MRYFILILSFLMVGCTTYADYEKEAIKRTKIETGCENISITLSVPLTGNGDRGNYIIETKACGKYQTYHCWIKDGCAFHNPTCVRVHVGSKPIKYVGKLK